jgi:hypothetical protein
VTISAQGVLHIANHSVPDLAREFGTPLMERRETVDDVLRQYPIFDE